MSEVQAALSGPNLVKRVALSTFANGAVQHTFDGK
jgi:hypothetical protein